MASKGQKMNEITLRKKSGAPALLQAEETDTLRTWMEAYFAVEITTSQSFAVTGSISNSPNHRQ
jgi:hypothetical protein